MSTGLDEFGPIDYLVVDFPGHGMTGEACLEAAESETETAEAEARATRAFDDTPA